MKRLAAIILCLAMVSGAWAAFDHVPSIKICYGLNAIPITKNVTAMWLAHHADLLLAGDQYSAYWDSTFTICRDSGKFMRVGPYYSSQQIILQSPSPYTATYASKLLDTVKNWYYIYAKGYMDSIGVSEETLVVHIADDYISITQQTGGNRAYTLTGLTAMQKRFSLQNWYNTSDDPVAYPGGTEWLANGYNLSSRRAYAHSYIRYIFEDTGRTWGPKSHSFHFNAYFMDNQYREYFAPTLNSYYTVVSTSGGATAGMDWVEQAGVGYSTDSAAKYFDNSTLKIDSAVHATLDSTCTAKGCPEILGFANTNKFDPYQVSRTIRDGHVNAISFENAIDYTKSAANWRNWYLIADTMAKYLNVQINWGIGYNQMCSAVPGTWNYDSARVQIMHLAFFLSVADTNAWLGPHNWMDTTQWGNIYEVNFGTPDGEAVFVDTNGAGDYVSLTYTVRRYLKSGNIVVVLRTANTSVDFVGGATPVDLGGSYYPIDRDGDTSQIAVTSVNLRPYEGWIGTKTIPTPAAGPIISCAPDTFFFMVPEGDPPPAAQTMSITNIGSGYLSWTASTPADWLDISSGNGSTPSDIALTVSPVGLAEGLYVTSITVSDPNAINNPIVVPVVFAVTTDYPPEVELSHSTVQGAKVTGGIWK